MRGICHRDSLELKETCIIGSECCLESQLFSDRIFRKLLINVRKVIKEKTLIEYAMQKLELESSSYNAIIKEKAPLPTSFNPSADPFDLKSFEYDIRFSTSILFAGFPPGVTPSVFFL